MKKISEEIQNMKITADTVLFFDMDGTLVDTNLANFLAYNKAIQSVTKSDSELTYNPHKRFNRSALKNAVPNLTDPEYERIVQEKEDYFEEFLHETKLITEYADILFKYSETNKTVLVTNCRQDRALETLGYHSLTDKFTKLFFGQFSEDGPIINKFENAIIELCISPKSVIAFENEESEIADAKEAGIEIINPVIR